MIISRKRLSDQILEYILDQIKTGKLKPGDKLMNERGIAEKLNVSRVPVREAINSLCQIGILVTKHGEGTFVNKYDPDRLGNTLYMYSLLDESPIIELVEVRKILESEAARLASQNATEEDIEKIKKLVEEREFLIKQKVDDEKIYEKLGILDRDFHKAIAEATYNTVFSKFLDSISRTLKIHQKKASFRTGMPERSNLYHRKILQAIIEKDSNKAAEMMYKHLEEVENAIIEQINNKENK